MTKDPPTGSLARLDRMVGKTGKKHAKAEPHPDTDALLDMIDKRVGQLLLRSSEIESKLDSIEGVQTVKTPKGKKDKTFTTRKVSTPTSKVVVEQKQNITISSNDFNKLISLIQDLQSEIKQMHSEQDEMRAQLNRMQDALFQEAEEEDM